MFCSPLFYLFLKLADYFGELNTCSNSNKIQLNKVNTLSWLDINVTNEFIAFIDLGKVRDQLDNKSFTIATYALCGFANFSSIAIQIGGIGALAPTRKSDLARMGLRAVAAGTMANFMSACIAGMLL